MSVIKEKKDTMFVAACILLVEMLIKAYEKHWRDPSEM